MTLDKIPENQAKEAIEQALNSMVDEIINKGDDAAAEAIKLLPLNKIPENKVKVAFEKALTALHA